MPQNLIYLDRVQTPPLLAICKELSNSKARLRGCNQDEQLCKSTPPIVYARDQRAI
jgi:hypothetical protein